MAALRNTTPFLFDRDFQGGRSRSEEMLTMSQHLAAIADTEARAFAAGAAEGRQIALDSETARIAAALERLGELAVEIARSEKRALEQEAASIDLAFVLAKKLADGAIAQFPLAAITEAAKECFTEARTAPHIAVRVHESLVEPVKGHLTALAADRGFAGKLIILGEPEIGVGDVRLEWADGGVVRDRATVEQAIARTLQRHIASVAQATMQGA